MRGNIFVRSKQDIKNEIVYINTSFNLFYFLEDLYSEKEKKFYYYNINEKKLYYAEILSLELLNIDYSRTEQIPKLYSTEFNDNMALMCFNKILYKIVFKKRLKEQSLDILKDVYAIRNKDKIGQREYSIYHSMKLSHFSLALPIIDQTISMKSNQFRNLLLYDNYIIPVESSETKTFAKIVDEDGELFLTLTNEKMLNIDYEYIYENKHKEIYRPYFYEFSLSDSSQKKLREMLKNQKYNQENLYKVELISLKNIKKKNEEQILEGELLFSASPIKQIPAFIRILHQNSSLIISNQLQKIEQFLSTQIPTIKDSKQIEGLFMSKINLTKTPNINFEIEIYNVGQGNWIHILIYSGKSLITKVIFDIGIGASSDISLRSQVTKDAARKITNNDTFVLSHWDSDHIQGIVELNRNQFYTNWIVPGLPNNPKNGAKRLAAFLEIDPNIDVAFIDDCLNGICLFENKYFKLGKGNGNGPSKTVSYTKENNSGLVLVIKTDSKKMLFPGDCEYIQFPRDFIYRQTYDALVVSHHGAKIKQADLTNIGFASSGRDKFAVVCVGKSPRYPERQHYLTISNRGFIINETRNYTNVCNPCQIKLI